MARFVFRLQPVLRLREREEQIAQRALAERLARLVELEDELKRLDVSMTAATDELRKNHLTGSIDLAFLAAHRRFVNSMQRRGVEVAQQMAKQQVAVNEARSKLGEAAKRKKAIEKLRERQLEAWQLDQSTREAAHMDEIGTQIGYANLADLTEEERAAAILADGDERSAADGKRTADADEVTS